MNKLTNWIKHLNTFENNFLRTPLGNILIIALAVYAIASDCMWKKLPSSK